MLRNGDGDGSGYGCGDGYGDGDSYGSGDGSGSGDGYGYGNGEKVAVVAGHPVIVARPWGVIRVGCHTHTVAEWRASWKRIAEKNGVQVSAAEVERILGQERCEMNAKLPEKSRVIVAKCPDCGEYVYEDEIRCKVHHKESKDAEAVVEHLRDELDEARAEIERLHDRIDKAINALITEELGDAHVR